MSRLYELLLFPEKAENLGQFSEYDVDLDHWKRLSSAFQRVFRTVYERGSGAILLVHGAQGTGKTLLSRRLEQDFEAAARGTLEPDAENLWHNLVGEAVPTRDTIERATAASVLRRVAPISGWLQLQSAFASQDTHRVRIFVIDDVHKDVFLREWAGLTQAEYLGFKARKEDAVPLISVAERLVEDCRGNFQRSIFLMLSNDAEKMNTLKREIDRSHTGLALVLELPLPPPEMKERIIRKNTNRLNRVSYWYCLDAAGKDERMAVHDVLNASDKGFTDSFVALDQALRSDIKRSGRPANRNLLTLVTLGAAPHVAKAFIIDRELNSEEHHCGEHIGVWLMREHWASILYQGSDPELSRRAKMVESEFALRWVAFDIKATWSLCQTPRQGDIGEQLLDIVRFVPSIGKPAEVKRHDDVCGGMEATIEAGGGAAAEVDAFEQRLQSLGQRRSLVYEEALAERLGAYNRGFAVYPSVKPDFIAGEYAPCAVTAARSRDHGAISEAIRRTGHAIEFTAYLRGDMEGLDSYLLEKVARYALLLESV